MSKLPSRKIIANSHIAQALNDLRLADYRALHQWSVQNRADYWQYAIKKLGIKFQQVPEKILQTPISYTQPEWLPGAKFNIVESCFQAKPDSIAITERNELGQERSLTSQTLFKKACAVAAGLQKQGYQVGDCIGVMLPMHCEAVIIYLGIILAGCTVVSIADSFATDAIATRLKISQAKAIFTQIEMTRAGKSLPIYEKLDELVIHAIVMTNNDQALRQGDQTYIELLADPDSYQPVYVTADHACNILFSSGTTGEPKAIPWTHATAIKAAADAYFHQDVHVGDILCWPTNLGWMMGPWLIFASLINGAGIALYEGVPTNKAFGQFVADTKVSMLGLVPSLVQAWRASGCMEDLDWSAIKCFSSSGECSTPEDMRYLMRLAGDKPVIEYCGGTEIGGAYITSTLVEPNTPSCFTTPTLGLDFVLLDEHGQACNNGEVALIPPSIGLSNTLLNKDHNEVYFKDMPKTAEGITLRRHGDQIERLPNGHYRALGRVDDTMNIGGIKVSSTEIERVLNTLEGIQETAAIAINGLHGGPSQLIIYCVLETHTIPKDLQITMQHAIKNQLNPLFKIKDVQVRERLPRTASNKIMRRELRAEYEKSLRGA